jgi:hypothetical protein
VTDVFYWATTVSVLFGPKMLFWGKVRSDIGHGEQLVWCDQPVELKVQADIYQ